MGKVIDLREWRDRESERGPGAHEPVPAASSFGAACASLPFYPLILWCASMEAWMNLWMPSTPRRMQAQEDTRCGPALR
ncbi:hypothetical protein [Marinimicrococcus flavescens]|uniref:Uncharacterized protein n=1 Tax=Marinimicrococcus flavescens TaxID=3031815 RepID=A0AAP3UYN8_9PROT|nr:hypothetical protein [Marinimicrococcus flavescens]